MKEITRIHLATVPFNIEVDAKKSLEKYIHAIERVLAADTEAMREIEARIAELLNERGVKDEKVITGDDVEAVRKQLGEPSEFGDDVTAAEIDNMPATKRVMRDSSNGLIGGVCSGLAAYWGIDVVWVRLATVALTILTSGAMVLVYIAAWIVMPPARTAAERLQMTGKPVTLAAIKEQSAALAKEMPSSKMGLKVLRIMAGVLMLIVAGSVIVGLAAAGYAALNYLPELQSLDVLLPAGILTLAGVLFVIMCLVIGHALIANRFTKKIGYSLMAIIVAGLIAASIGGIGLRFGSEKMMKEYQENQVEKRVDVSSLTGAKKLVVDSELPLQVNYNARPESPEEGTLWYNRSRTNDDVKVSLEKQDDGVVRVRVSRDHITCLPDVTQCRNDLTLTLVGPQLESVEAVSSNEVRYIMDSQDRLATSTRADGRVSLQTVGALGELDAKLANESRLDATDANVKSAKISIEDRLSNVDLAKVETLDITIPTSCASSYGQGEIDVEDARQVTVNGQKHESSSEYPCMKLDIGED